MKSAITKTTKPAKTTIVAVPIVAEKSEPTETAARVVKRGVCPTLSGKSTVCFEIGVDGRGDVQLRVVENSGSGSFSDDWVRFRDIQAALDRAPKGTSVTSHLLHSLFRGVSQNTVGFIWAILVKEWIVAPSATKRRYDRLESSAFLAQVRELMEGRTTSGAGEKKSKNPAATKAVPSKPKKGNKATKN